MECIACEFDCGAYGLCLVAAAIELIDSFSLAVITTRLEDGLKNFFGLQVAMYLLEFVFSGDTILDDLLE